ncbi:MAG: LytR/AlgR family response regulator transcription factor [Sphingobacterium siyangense]
MNKLNYRVLIVDDEPDSLVYVLMSLKELPFINEDIEIVNNPVQAIEYLKESEVDILILDMDLGDADIDGIKLAKLIPNPPLMVACSAHTDYVFKANEAGIYTYFSKKISFNALKAKMEDVVEMVDKRLDMKTRDVKTLRVKTLDSKMIDIEVEEIFYATVNNLLVDIFMKEESHRYRGSLRALQSELPVAKFARPRRNTLVNLAKVDLVRTDELYLMKPRNTFPILMTRSYKENFKHQYEVYKQNNK